MISIRNSATDTSRAKFLLGDDGHAGEHDDIYLAYFLSCGSRRSRGYTDLVKQS